MHVQLSQAAASTALYACQWLRLCVVTLSGDDERGAVNRRARAVTVCVLGQLISSFTQCRHKYRQTQATNQDYTCVTHSCVREAQKRR
jgi:hypothetical protein